MHLGYWTIAVALVVLVPFALRLYVSSNERAIRARGRKIVGPGDRDVATNDEDAQDPSA
jgi:hypothetical protein